MPRKTKQNPRNRKRNQCLQLALTLEEKQSIVAVSKRRGILLRELVLLAVHVYDSRDDEVLRYLKRLDEGMNYLTARVK